MTVLERTHNEQAVSQAMERLIAPLRGASLRWPVCQDRAERRQTDPARRGTVCQGCRYDMLGGCANPRVWSLANGRIEPLCEADDLVYCKHYDCGCALCASLR